MKIMLDPGAYRPTRAHDTDAGLDIRAFHGGTIGPMDSAVFHTGVHVELPKGTAGLLVSKSGLNKQFGITSTGLIDQGYSGEILVILHNHGNKVVQIMPGDKISQLVIINVRLEPVEIVGEIGSGDRGANGFGSTGR